MNRAKVLQEVRKIRSKRSTSGDGKRLTGEEAAEIPVELGHRRRYFGARKHSILFIEDGLR